MLFVTRGAHRFTTCATHQITLLRPTHRTASLRAPQLCMVQLPSPDTYRDRHYPCAMPSSSARCSSAGGKSLSNCAATISRVILGLCIATLP